MKKIQNIISFVVAFGLTTLFATSCTDKNEWDVDGAYDRLFSVSKMSISADKTEAEFTWTGISGTEYYIIEISKDSLYDEVPTGGSNAIVYGEDKSITKSPCTFTGLEGATKYYLRMKGISGTKESRWAYPEKYFFTTKQEQIMLPVASADKTSNSVMLRWDAAGTPVTHIILSWQEGEETKSRQVDLNIENIENQSVKIEDLLEATSYKAAIFNGNAKRGEVAFMTFTSVPADGTAYYLTGNENIYDFIQGITDENVVLVLPAGSTFVASWLNEESVAQTTLPIKEGIKSITFWGEDGDTKPVLNATTIKLANSSTKIAFRNIEYKGNNSASDYVLNESATHAMSEILFNDCIVNTVRGVVRTQNGANASVIDNIIFNNCVIYNVAGYGLLTMDGATSMSVSTIRITNSTFYNMEVFCVFNKPVVSELTVENCTFYNAITNGKYIVSFNNSTANIPAKFAINNCIFGKYNYATAEPDPSQSVRATNPKITDTFAFGTYVTSDFVINTGYPFSGSFDYDKSSAALFVNPGAADFHIKDSGFAGTGVAGDPRWW